MIRTQIPEADINYRQTDDDYVTIDLSEQEAKEVAAELDYLKTVVGGELTTIRAHIESASIEQWDHRTHMQSHWTKGVHYGPTFKNIQRTTDPECGSRVTLAETLAAIKPAVSAVSSDYQRWKEAAEGRFQELYSKNQENWIQGAQLTKHMKAASEDEIEDWKEWVTTMAGQDEKATVLHEGQFPQREVEDRTVKKETYMIPYPCLGDISAGKPSLSATYQATGPGTL